MASPARWWERAAWLGQGALVFIDVLKLLATPLVFVAIVDTFVSTRLPLKRALVLLPLSAINAINRGRRNRPIGRGRRPRSSLDDI